MPLKRLVKSRTSLFQSAVNVQFPARAGQWICTFFVLLILIACQVGAGRRITSKPYTDLIGARYRVDSETLYAYGVYESLNDRKVTFIELVPLNIAGSEIAFRHRIAKGQIIRIVSAWRHLSLLESGVYYVVDVENSDLPSGIPIRLELSRGNQGAGGDLNPAIYTRLRERRDTGVRPEPYRDRGIGVSSTLSDR